MLRTAFATRLAGLGAAVAIMAAPLAAQRTRAERTAARETSSHDDVVAFVDSVARGNPEVRIGPFGISAQGRRVPYLVVSRPLVSGPADAHRTGKPIVYIQANIHGGEVEGKEASLMLVRDLTRGALRPLLDSLVLVVVPDYNSDGNDAFGPGSQNRRGQDGPAVVGRRSNGQGLDLNRDMVKQESPEARALLALVDAWDPDLFLDLHTTNGSYHGYLLTYSPGLNPNSSPANDWVRDRLLPDIRRRMRERHRQETFWYGNFRNQTPDSLVQGWETYEPHPRYATNWFGIRNRMAILSEAYSNAPFATRISVTYNFVLEILRYAAAERETIKTLIARSDRIRPDSVVVRSDFAEPSVEEVIAEITEPAREGSGPYARRTRTGVFRTIRMPVYDRFRPVASEPIRAGFLVPAQHGHLVELLRRQGIVVERMNRTWSGAVEAFAIDSVAAAANPFEGHRLVRIIGAWSADTATAAEGWYFVPTDQRLGVLAAYLLEPRAEDGFVTWNLLDRDLRRGLRYPILRVAAPPPGRIMVP